MSSKKIHLETEKENLISDENLCCAEFKKIVNEINTLLDELSNVKQAILNKKQALKEQNNQQSNFNNLLKITQAVVSLVSLF